MNVKYTSNGKYTMLKYEVYKVRGYRQYVKNVSA